MTSAYNEEHCFTKEFTVCLSHFGKVNTFLEQFLQTALHNGLSAKAGNSLKSK